MILCKLADHDTVMMHCKAVPSLRTPQTCQILKSLQLQLKIDLVLLANSNYAAVK